MKNADLEALLKGRGLPHTGKKAEMVDRLQKDDEKSSSKPNAGAEDEIDWDDEVEETAAAPVAPTEEPVTSNEETAVNAGGKSQLPNPQVIPDQVADIHSAAADDLSVQPATDGGVTSTSADAQTEKPKEPVPSYSKGLAATDLDEEIEKRKKRALKFGIKLEDDEGLKKLERAKKFGAVGPPQGLDEALPERNRKRGHEAGDEAGGSKRRDGGGRGGARGGRGGRDYRDHRDRNGRNGRDNRRGDNRSSNGQDSSWMSEKDRAAAEARKAKFARPTA